MAKKIFWKCRENCPKRCVIAINDKEGKIDQTLEEIFPQNGYQPDRMGWAHWFERVE